MNIKKWLSENTASLAGKTVAISGATGGLGGELVEYLASLGAKLITVSRSESKYLQLEARIKERYPLVQIENILTDFESIDEIKECAEQLSRRDIDYLILNAGAYSIPRKICTSGYDNVFQINCVSPYFLARELAPQIKRKGGRVVAVGSIAHRYSVTDTDDIDFRTRTRASLAYGNAKRHLMFSLMKLFDGSDSLSVVHPGITFTNITSHYPKLIFALIKYPMKIIFMKPKYASLSILLGLFEPTRKNEWIGPSVFDVWGKPKKRKLHSVDAAEFGRIAESAEEIYDKCK